MLSFSLYSLRYCSVRFWSLRYSPRSGLGPHPERLLPRPVHIGLVHYDGRRRNDPHDLLQAPHRSTKCREMSSDLMWIIRSCHNARFWAPSDGLLVLFRLRCMLCILRSAPNVAEPRDWCCFSAENQVSVLPLPRRRVVLVSCFVLTVSYDLPYTSDCSR